MDKRIIAVSAVIAALICAPACAAETSARIESFSLANGLEVIVIPNHRIPAVSQMIWYKVGAADDPRGKSGLAHFHEHTMFLGTARHKGGEYAAIAASHGGDENAFTGHDGTAYFINSPKSELPLVMELEADRMNALTPSDDAMEREKQVIIEERRMRIENNPEAMLAEQADAALFRNHPYHWPTIGWMNEMEGLTKQDVLDFHKAWYHPNNAILILSGDITAAEAKPLVEKYYGHLPKAAMPPRHWTDEPPQNTARRITLHHPNVKQPQWTRTYAVASVAYGKKEEALPLFILGEILGGGKSSRLYQSLVVEQKLASKVDVDYSGFTIGPSTFEIGIIPENDVSMETLEKAVDKELQRAVTEGYTDKELGRAKTLLKAETIYARDGLEGMGRIMGWVRMCSLGTDYFTKWPDTIDAVTPEQISAAAKDSLLLTQSVTAFLLPEETP